MVRRTSPPLSPHHHRPPSLRRTSRLHEDPSPHRGRGTWRCPLRRPLGSSSLRFATGLPSPKPPALLAVVLPNWGLAGMPPSGLSPLPVLSGELQPAPSFRLLRQRVRPQSHDQQTQGPHFKALPGTLPCPSSHSKGKAGEFEETSQHLASEGAVHPPILKITRISASGSLRSLFIYPGGSGRWGRVGGTTRLSLVLPSSPKNPSSLLKAVSLFRCLGGCWVAWPPLSNFKMDVVGPSL